MYSETEIKVQKLRNQVSLPELVTDLVTVQKTKVPEEENEKYEDAQALCATIPKVAAVAPWDPKKDMPAQECETSWNRGKFHPKLSINGLSCDQAWISQKEMRSFFVRKSVQKNFYA